jgi:hypothetical protein
LFFPAVHMLSRTARLAVAIAITQAALIPPLRKAE